VATVVKQRVEGLRHAEDQGGRLPGQALNLLAGREVQSVDEVIAEISAVTAAEIAKVADAACAAGLLMTPQTRADWAGFTAAPSRSEAAVIGTAYASLEGPDDHLIIGPEGVSLVRGDNIATVRFDACAIVRAWPDGGRQFVGFDGIVVVVEPSLYGGALGALPWLDARIPPGLRVDHPPRDPSRIPQPATPAWPAAQPASTGGGKGLGIVGLIVLIPVTLVLVGFAALLALALATDSSAVAGDDSELAGFWVLIVILLTLAGVCGLGIHRAARRVYRS
jgi:hypothetical protein